jgi:hypothetical protein
MHGLAEMHFFFTAVTMMTPQRRVALWPGCFDHRPAHAVCDPA